jgi:hypothetical protein
MFKIGRPGVSANDAHPDLSAGLARALRRPKVVNDAPVADQAGEAAVVLSAAITTIDRASRIVRDAAAKVIEAAGETDPAERALLAEQYDDLRRKVDALAAQSEASILTTPGAQSLQVPLRGATYVVVPFALTADEHGLGLPPPEEGFETHAEVAEVLRRVENAMEALARARVVYEHDRDFLMARSAAKAA